MWLLQTRDDASTTLTFRILPGNIKTIGRATGADFIVDASLVSRLHCRVSAGTAELEVVDLDSTNGTYVNGKRVDRSTLQSGDALGVGDVQLIVSRAEADGRA